MPIYYLTDKEINALYLYLQSVKNGKKIGEKNRLSKISVKEVYLTV